MKSTATARFPIAKVAASLVSHENCASAGGVARGFSMKGRKSVYQALDDLVTALFPGCHGESCAHNRRTLQSVTRHLRSACYALRDQAELAFRYQCTFDRCLDCSQCPEQADAAVAHLLHALPEIQKTLQQDIVAAYEGDPAAHSIMEVVMSYPGLQAIIVHRIAHVLYQAGVPMIPRIMSERAHSQTGIDIHPGARIGPGFFIDHGTGVVIGETSVIGRHVKLYQGVTLGALSFPKDKNGNPIKGIKRHPNVEDNVTIYAGATILGGETTIGAGSEIGGNVWLTHSVPPNSRVYNRQPRPLIRKS